jgi:autotransporter-associated beta strand protein
VDNSQTINAGSTVNVFALNVGPYTIASGGGTTTLQMGSGATGTQSGVILNGGTIATSFLGFDNAEAVIYTSRAGGTIQSVIRGDGGLVTFGPGQLNLMAANTYQGGTTVQAGTLAAMNTSGSATGPGPVTVNTQATLLIAGNVGGFISVKNGGTLALAGGTAASGVNVDSFSFLQGYGTIAGPAVINGTINAGPTIGTLTFADAVVFNGGTIFTWRLSALDSEPGNAGVFWNTLRFTTTDGALNLGLMPSDFSESNKFGVTMDLSGVPDPNSGDPFWSVSHTWLLFEATNKSFDVLNYGVGTGPAYLQGSFHLISNGTTMDGVITGATTLSLRYIPNPVPEPSAVVLLMAGLAGLVAWQVWRARRNRCGGPQGRQQPGTPP